MLARCKYRPISKTWIFTFSFGKSERYCSSLLSSWVSVIYLSCGSFLHMHSRCSGVDQVGSHSAATRSSARSTLNLASPKNTKYKVYSDMIWMIIHNYFFNLYRKFSLETELFCLSKIPSKWVVVTCVHLWLVAVPNVHLLYTSLASNIIQ